MTVETIFKRFPPQMEPLLLILQA